ncbi:MAG: hypothetical protein LC803_12395 [Acidobacteria bacterium]|nr:hypothetical protein [Acidobacteriota bacterium]
MVERTPEAERLPAALTRSVMTPPDPTRAGVVMLHDAAHDFCFRRTRMERRHHESGGQNTGGSMSKSMNVDKLPATASKSETGNAARPGGFEQTGRRATTTTRTVGVYERPARRMKVSLPLVIILILAALVSVVATARFLF